MHTHLRNNNVADVPGTHRIILYILLALFVFAIPVSAYDRISQGETVYVNETVDISGVLGWAYSRDTVELAWYHGYEASPYISPEVITLPQPPRKWASYYFDPEIYRNRLGPWYQYNNGSEWERAGNLLAFVVKSQYNPNTTLTFRNGTVVTIDIYNNPYRNEIPTPVPTQSFLAERYVADYIIASGDPLTVRHDNSSCRLWLFGKEDGVYDIPSTNNRTTISPYDIASYGLSGTFENFKPGSYKLIVHYPGKNTIFEASYSHEENRLIPGLYGKKPVDLAGIPPMMAYDRFKDMLVGSDDTFVVYNVEIEPPTISVSQIGEFLINNVTVLDVRGYTNVANGTTLKFILDEDRQTIRTLRSSTFYTDAIGDKPGNLRQYHIYIPFSYEDMAPGQHTITAYEPYGSYSSAPWYIYDIPEGMDKPNKTVKYISGRYGPEEFVPTPTPIIQKVTVTIPVRNDTFIVKEVPQAKAEVEAIQWGIISTIVLWVVASIVTVGVVVAVAWYLDSVRKRARRIT